MASKLPPHLQHLTEALPANRRAEVEKSILSSNYLQTRLAEESKADRLDQIRILPPGSNSGGHFSEADKSIYIDADLFSMFKDNKEQRRDRITYVLGHEVSHSAMTPLRTVSTKELNSALSNAMWTETDLGYVDVTPAAEKYLQNARRDESVATISAWNALANRVDSENPGQLSKQELVSRVAIVGDCTVGEGKNLHLAPGIALSENQDIFIGKPWANSQNVEAVAKCYFDQSPEKTNLGAAGNSDYANRYGASVIQMIDANIEGFKSQHPGTPNSIRLDFDKLELDPKLLQSNGLNLASQDVMIYDTSHGKIRQVTLQNTGSANGHSPEIETEIAQNPRADAKTPASIETSLRAIDILGPKEREKYEQALTQANRLGLPEDQTQNLAMSMVYKGTENGTIKRIDDIVVMRDMGEGGGDRVHLMFKPHGDRDPIFNDYVDLNKAAGTPAIESATQTRDLALTKEQAAREAAITQSQSGPTMKIGGLMISPTGFSDGGSEGSGGDGGG